jgi:hypothetical protein
MASRENERRRREWTERLVRYRAGGLTVARFCTQERVSVKTFYYWSRRVCSDTTENAVQRARPTNSEVAVVGGTHALGGRGPQGEPATSGVWGSEVRFRFDAAVEVSVPAECLDAFRCLVECVGRLRVERDAAFGEIIVATR